MPIHLNIFSVLLLFCWNCSYHDHLVVHLNIFSVTISDIIRWFGFVNIRGASTDRPPPWSVLRCIQVARVVCFSSAILKTTCRLLWGSMVLFPCLPLMHTSSQDIQIARSLQYLASALSSVCSFCLWPPLCTDEGVIRLVQFHPLTALLS